MPTWFFVTLCIVVPAGWAIAMHQTIALLDKARERRRRPSPPSPEAKQELPPVDYSI